MKAFIVIIVYFTALVGFLDSKENRNFHSNGEIFAKKQQFKSFSDVLSLNHVEVYYDASSNLLAFVNGSAQVGAIFELNSTNFFLINGQSGKVFVIEPSANKIKSVANNSWHSFENDFKNFSTNDYYIKNGEMYNISDANGAILEEVKAIGQLLGIPANALRIFTIISSTLHHCRSVLPGCFSQSNHMTIPNGILSFVNILKAIAKLIFDIFGRPILLIPKIILSLPEILSSSNGFEAFIKVLQQISREVDFSQNVARVLNDKREIFNAIINFGDPLSSHGIDNTFKTCFNILNFRNSQLPLESFMQNFLNRNPNYFRFENSTFLNLVENFSNIIQEQNRRFHNIRHLQGFASFINGLKNRNLNINGLEFSQIVQMLQEGNFFGVVQSIIRFLMKLNNTFNPLMVIPKTILSLISSRFNISDINSLFSGEGFLNFGNTSNFPDILNIFPQINGENGNNIFNSGLFGEEATKASSSVYPDDNKDESSTPVNFETFPTTNEILDEKLKQNRIHNKRKSEKHVQQNRGYNRKIKTQLRTHGSKIH